MISEIIKSRFENGYTFEELLTSNVYLKKREEQLLDLLDDKAVSGKDDMAFGGLMIGDFIYDYLRLDPNVIKASDFSRMEDITNLFEFRSFSERINGSNTASFDGNVHNLKGYLGEQMAAQKLQSQGYEVEFPATSNNEGYDLLINGEKFQVKISSDGQSIKNHLSEHPDIPVFTNSDIPESIKELPNVFPIEGITEQGLEDITRESLDAGIEIFELEIPGILAAVAVGKNTFRLINGDLDVKTAGINVGVEVAARGGGAVAGAKIVGLMGAALGPYGVIVGGMVGAVIGGSKMNHLGNSLKKKIWLADETSELNKKLNIFLSAAYTNSVEVREIFDRKTQTLLNNLHKLGNEFNSLYDFVSKKIDKEREYLNDQINKLDGAKYNPRVLVPNYVKHPNEMYISGQSIITAMKAKVHPYSIQDELTELSLAVKAFQAEYRKM